MSAIRPDLPSSLPAANPVGPTAQAKAAQAAFFRAAMGGVQAVAPQPQTPPTQTTQPASQTTAQDSPRLPRLGQFLDIRV